MRAGGQTHQTWWHWKKRFGWSLVTHGEAAFGVPRGTQILSPEGDKPHAGYHKICYQLGFLTSWINRNYSEARKEIQARLCWGPCCSSGKWEQSTGSLAGLLRGGGGEGGVKAGVCPGVGLVCPPLRWHCVQGPGTVPCFSSWPPAFLLQALQKWQVGFLVPLYLLSVICSNCTCTQPHMVS